MCPKTLSCAVVDVVGDGRLFYEEANFLVRVRVGCWLKDFGVVCAFEVQYLSQAL